MFDEAAKRDKVQVELSVHEIKTLAFALPRVVEIVLETINKVIEANGDSNKITKEQLASMGEDLRDLAGIADKMKIEMADYRPSDNLIENVMNQLFADDE
jgi:hypothetical protein